MPELLDQRAQDLRKMKRVATLLFLLMCALFIFSVLFQDLLPGLSYLKAAAEGGMVGAVADWFAVTALFRHPLGLKIPHTNLIQRKKDELGASLGDFVQQNFLTPEVISAKLRQAELGLSVGGYLSSQEGAEATTAQASAVAIGALNSLDDEQVLTVLQVLANDYVVAPEWSTTLGTLGQKLVDDGHHEAAVELIAGRAGSWVADHPEVFVEVVSGRSPSWVPRMVDEMLAQKVHQELRGLLFAVAGNERHPLRLALTDWLAEFTVAMQHDPETIAKVEQFKHSLLGDQQLRELAIRGWASLKSGLIESLQGSASPLNIALRSAITTFGQRLQSDSQLRGNLEDRVITGVASLVEQHGLALAGLVSDTVQAWDPAEASEKLELQVGRDLQFIRINGTVIGSLAGVVIFSAGELISSFSS
ncbi:DUF445 domain-containing protein [Glutamicibacter arilaitensis]|uniref:DUF445 domain-containing protein n=1 Tax=Glutamicibacter arilaitensis TaxID=256701 RepID=UPI00384DC5DB